MKAFFVANVTVKDADKFQAYAKAAGESMQPFGGEVMTKGKVAKNLAGNFDYQNVAIVGFPDLNSLESWFNSDEYQALIPLREEAADILLTAFDVPN